MEKEEGLNTAAADETMRSRGGTCSPSASPTGPAHVCPKIPGVYRPAICFAVDGGGPDDAGLKEPVVLSVQLMVLLTESSTSHMLHCGAAPESHLWNPQHTNMQTAPHMYYTLAATHRVIPIIIIIIIIIIIMRMIVIFLAATFIFTPH
ncbi:unnamed protein product [Pleuronectes platessa]|uniref:Uncharacterized protein n=1 Tax=Pleuronectes platessa TaxID=8262 RepID=A0A9N7UXR5_PLEPL|nr:unnamed protein product [Pleuronectes platessa]